MSETSEYSCDKCEQDVPSEAVYCPNCGALFGENIRCSRHPDRLAGGVCVICGTPSCHECGSFVQGVFLCAQHSHYKVFEGMASVYVSIDVLQAQYAENCLEQAGLHPFLFSRRFNPGGGILPTFVRGIYTSQAIGGYTVLLPYAEVLQGEKIIRESTL